MPDSLIGRLERTDDLQTLLIGPRPLIRVQVPLRGDTVAIVDPSAPAPSLRLVIGDRAASSAAVENLLGEPALDAIWGGDDRTDFPVEPGVALAALQRLALLQWLQWDSPDNPDPELIDLERAVAIWDLMLAMDEGGLRAADTLGNRRQVQRLITEVAIFGARSRPAEGVLRPLLADLIDDFLAEKAGDSGQRRVLEQQREAFRDAADLGDVDAFDRERAFLETDPASQEPAELAGAGDQFGVAEPTAAATRTVRDFVDPAQIPRLLHGILDSTADAVEWAIRPDHSVDVTVARHPDGPMDGRPLPFRARVVGRSGEILASAPLDERADGEAFVAHLQLPGPVADPAEVRVDVCADEQKKPAVGPTLALHKAQHQVGWALAVQRRRLLIRHGAGEGEGPDEGDPTPDHDVRRLWQEAANRFFDADEPELGELAITRSRTAETWPLPVGLGPTLAEIDALARR